MHDDAGRWFGGQLDTILATIPVGVFIVDIQGRVVSTNEHARTIWGGEPPPFSSVDDYHHFLGWWPETGVRLAAREWAPVRALLTGELVTAEVVDIERFDGKRATIVNSAAPLRDATGAITGAVAAMQDVTEQRERQRANELLLEALRALAGSLDLSEVLKRLVHVLIETGLHTRATVMMLHEDTDELEIAAAVGEPTAPVGTRVPLGETSLMLRAAVEGKRIVVADFTGVPEADRGQAALPGIAASLIVPLVRSGRLLGVVTVDEMRPGVSFTEREVTLVEGIASSAALAIENSRLYEAEHRVALTLQQALLALPERLEGLSFAHAYRSASEDAFVGGDFYDLFEIDGPLVGVLIGDIAGKGLEAAVLTQLVKNTVRAHAAEKGSSPAKILQLTNNIFYQSTSSDSFATVFFGVLNRATGTMAYTNAGHTTALLLRSSGVLAELPADSPLVGAFADREYVQSEALLRAGDVLLLYTDGVTEARASGRLYGEARLLRHVATVPQGDPVELVRDIVEDVLGFTQGALNDDLAILAIKRLEGRSERPLQQRLEVSAL